MNSVIQRYSERILAVTVLCSIGPFFIWKDYLGGIGYIFYQGLQILTLVILVTLVFWRRTTSIKFYASMCMVLLFLFLSLFTGVVSGTYLPLLPGNISTFALFSLFVVTDEEFLVGSFDSLKTILTVIFVYTIIIFLVVLLGVSIPSSIIETGRTLISAQYYVNYLGCLFLDSGYGVRLDRFTSMFEEPGVVGTISAMVLVASNFDLKSDKRNVVFLVSGLLSLSLAFICMTGLYFLINAFKRGLYKIAVFSLLVAVSYIVFINIDFESESISELQTRVTLNDDSLERNSRIKQDAQDEYDDFLRGDALTLLFGYGRAFEDRNTGETIWSRSASYRKIVYYFGVVGFGLYVLWMVVFPYACYKTTDRNINYNLVVYILIFLISVYQRPAVKSVHFLYFLLAGCAYTKRGGNNNTPRRM